MQQGGLQAQTEKRITELKKLTHELEIHGCGQENAIYDLAAEMADVEGSIQKELDHFRQGSTHRLVCAELVREFHKILVLVRCGPCGPKVWKFSGFWCGTVLRSQNFSGPVRCVGPTGS